MISSFSPSLTRILPWLTLLFALILAGCSPKPNPAQIFTKQTPLEAQDQSSTENESSATVTAPGATNTTSDQPRALYFDGSGKFYEAPRQAVPAVEPGQGDGYNLNFSDASIRAVVGAVIGDIVGQPYFVDPSVQGTLSLQTSGEVSRTAMVSILETVLRVKGLALVDVNGVWHVVPVGEAPRRITAIRVPIPESIDRPGFGVQIVMLRYASPTQMRELLEPFAPQGGILRADDSRNMLLLAGTRAEISSMLQTIATFDVDWLAGMSYAIFTAKYVEAETLAKELLNIFGDPESPLAGIVRLVPIPRLNALLAISPKAEYLRQVESWIERLDIGGASPGRKIYVYHVQNGRAGDLAAAIGMILGQAVPSGNSGSGITGGSGSGRTINNRTAATSSANTTSTTGMAAFGESLRDDMANNRPEDNSPPNAFEAGGLRIVPNEENNSILILATPSEFGVVESALKQMDIPPRQVLIEASLAEVTLTDELRYGVQWAFTPDDHSITLSENSSGAVSPEFPGFSYVYTGLNNARGVLNALESLTDVNVLFAPKLMVLNNQSAILQVGDQVPVPVQSSVSVTDPDAPIVNTIQFRDTGVILSVTPRINQGGLVLIDIDQEVSEVARTTSSGIDAPTIQQRKITSTVAVQSGDTIALGGLIRETISNGRSGVPLLSRIPVLGAAFGSRDKTVRRTELIVLITPRIVRDVRETNAVMEYLREQFKSMQPPPE